MSASSSSAFFDLDKIIIGVYYMLRNSTTIERSRYAEKRRRETECGVVSKKLSCVWYVRSLSSLLELILRENDSEMYGHKSKF